MKKEKLALPASFQKKIFWNKINCYLLSCFKTKVGRHNKNGYHHRRSQSMIPNQYCCLTRLPYDDFPHIYMFFLFFCLWQKLQGFLSHFVWYHFHIALWPVWKRCFSPVILKVFGQNTSGPALRLILRFGNASILFSFFIFFLFVLSFLKDIISKVAAARQMYATIEGINFSLGSVHTF